MRVVLTLLLSAMVLVGCGDPNPPDGVIVCASGGAAVCPRNYKCVDGHCFKNSSNPTDMGVHVEDDMAGVEVGPDMANALCGNGKLDPGEIDVDCGGSCGLCQVNQKCGAAADCITASCVSNVCALVSGPPNWLSSTPLTLGARYDHGMGVDSSGRLYVFDGFGGSAASTRIFTTERYTPGAPSWEHLADTIGNHSTAFAVASDAAGNPCLMGGRNPDSIRSVDCFDPAKNAWFSGTDDTLYRASIAAASAGGLIYVFGDSLAPDNQVNQAYSSVTKMWTLALMIPEGRTSAAAATGRDGRIYLVGGTDGASSYVDTAEVYDPTINQWAAKTKAMSAKRAYLVAAAGGDGRIYAIGGVSATSGDPLNTVDAYMPATDTWVPVAPMTDKRSFAAGATGGDGRIYVAGGSNFATTSAVADVEAYGPVTQLSAASAAPGAQVDVSGSNFAVNATVRVYFDDPSKAPIATGKSDVVGTLAAIHVTMPASASAGAHKLITVDVRSQFPSIATVTVTP